MEEIRLEARIPACLHALNMKHPLSQKNAKALPKRASAKCSFPLQPGVEENDSASRRQYQSVQCKKLLQDFIVFLFHLFHRAEKARRALVQENDTVR